MKLEPTDEDIFAAISALDEAVVPAKNRWGINEKGETVQLTDGEGKPTGVEL